MDISAELRAHLTEVEPYPQGVRAVPQELPFRAFFPGGRGVWDEASDPRGGMMILGHNFYHVAGYEKMLREGLSDPARRDANTPTWRNLLSTLMRADIAPQDCFFTNAYQGLMESDSSMGAFPGAKNAEFVERCQHFFRVQLELVRPRLLVTLGVHVPPFLAPLSELWRDKWLSERGKAHTLPQIDEAGGALTRTEIALPSGEMFSLRTVVLTHPAQQWPNVRRRRYKELESYEAETQMLRDGLTF